MIQKRWFRIETAKDGSILSCSEVEAKGKGGGVVRFYEAADAADACAQAKAWYAAERQRCNAGVKQRAAARKARGLCISCKTPSPDFARCKTCRDRYAEYQRLQKSGLSNKRQAADPVEQLQRKKDRAAAFKAKKGGSAKYQYSLILSKLDKLSPGEAPAFRAWLVGKIEAAKTKNSPKPTPEPGQVVLQGGRDAKRKRIDWFESNLESAAE